LVKREKIFKKGIYKTPFMWYTMRNSNWGVKGVKNAYGFPDKARKSREIHRKPLRKAVILQR
jgi:hypothetical protein